MEACGLVNVYTCQDCGYKHNTININTGTTPFGIKCRKCGKYNALSGMYGTSISGPIKYAWYRPTKEELEKLEKEQPGWKDHVLGGGLVMKELADFPERISYEEWQEICLEQYGEWK